MKKNRIKERAAKAAPHIKREIDLSIYTAKQIRERLNQKGLSQRDLAEILNAKESQVSKWLTGMHNFTYATVAKIETALDFKIIKDTPEVKIVKVYQTLVSSQSINLHLGAGENKSIPRGLQPNLPVLNEPKTAFSRNVEINILPT